MRYPLSIGHLKQPNNYTGITKIRSVVFQTCLTPHTPLEYTGKYTGIAYHQVLQVLYCITFCAIKIKTSV